MEIARIKSPKYRVGRYILNEYELRTLQIEVCLGQQPTGIKVKDEKGNIANILSDGNLDSDLYGLSLATDLKFQLLKLRLK